MFSRMGVGGRVDRAGVGLFFLSDTNFPSTVLITLEGFCV